MHFCVPGVQGRRKAAGRVACLGPTGAPSAIVLGAAAGSPSGPALAGGGPWQHCPPYISRPALASFILGSTFVSQSPALLPHRYHAFRLARLPAPCASTPPLKPSRQTLPRTMMGVARTPLLLAALLAAASLSQPVQADFLCNLKGIKNCE